MRLLRLLGLALLLLTPTLARATMIVPLELAELVAHADRVAVGRVEALKARWTADHSAIVTEVHLRVERPLKGGLREGEAVTVLREGGVVDGMGMMVPGAARFTVGEQVVVFLERRGTATWTVGMSLGKMHVATVGGRAMAYREIGGLAFTRPAAPEPTVRPLDALCDTIRALAKPRGSR